MRSSPPWTGGRGKACLSTRPAGSSRPHGTGRSTSSAAASEDTMAKRLVRAKYKIQASNIPYRVPDGDELPRRLRAVLSVLYLIYNAGADDVRRRDLRAEAIRLTRL